MEFVTRVVYDARGHSTPKGCCAPFAVCVGPTDATTVRGDDRCDLVCTGYASGTISRGIGVVSFGGQEQEGDCIVSGCVSGYGSGKTESRKSCTSASVGGSGSMGAGTQKQKAGSKIHKERDGRASPGRYGDEVLIVLDVGMGGLTPPNRMDPNDIIGCNLRLTRTARLPKIKSRMCGSHMLMAQYHQGGIIRTLGQKLLILSMVICIP